jgi:hypothetical protein
MQINAIKPMYSSKFHKLLKNNYDLEIPEGFKIVKAYGEEKPERLLFVLYILFEKEFTYTPIPNKPEYYRFQCDTYEFDYVIADENTNKTSPDFYLETNQSYNYFIEDTGCGIEDSGNNAQAQRSTKFIPTLNTNDRCVYMLSDPNAVDIQNKKTQATLAYPFKQWRTSHVSVIFENPDTMESFLSLESYTNYQSLIDSHNQLRSTPTDIFNYDSETNTIKLHLNTEGSKYNLLKSHKDKGKELDNDPGIGHLSLCFLTIDNISKKNNLPLPSIILENIAWLPEQIKYQSSGNKILRSLKHLIDIGFNIQFQFTNAIPESLSTTFDIHRFTGYETGKCPFKNEGSVSEKIVSMYHVSTLSNTQNIVFEQHARSENTKVNYNNTILDFPKLNKTKPDIIIQNTTLNKIDIIEAELYDKLTTGQKQIDYWSTSKQIYNYYREKCNITEDMDIYLELYDQKNEFNGDFSLAKFKNVKYILNANGIWYENTDHYEPLQFSF